MVVVVVLAGSFAMAMICVVDVECVLLDGKGDVGCYCTGMLLYVQLVGWVIASWGHRKTAA